MYNFIVFNSSFQTSKMDVVADPMNDKYSIKNLLFTKAMPNYVIPISVNGHQVHACIDCGDK